MSDFFDRFDKYMKFKQLNDNKVTVDTGISNGLIGKARKRGGLSQENISKILHTYEDINANWWFRGIGEMILGNESDNTKSVDWEKIIKSQQELLDLKNNEIANLKRKEN
ncbi:hypothetical protein [Chryseobacterium carnipullorum]|uniref:hypothetical protein n=1 Tax=Chryseobacterium carnipullorum TaxID=1124835 RepID=UPI0023F1EC0F|nr:hypothetical protein [Chryseobacterium carnipullorum]